MKKLATALAALSDSPRDQVPEPILASIDESLAALARSRLETAHCAAAISLPTSRYPTQTGRSWSRSASGRAAARALHLPRRLVSVLQPRAARVAAASPGARTARCDAGRDIAADAARIADARREARTGLIRCSPISATSSRDASASFTPSTNGCAPSSKGSAFNCPPTTLIRHSSYRPRPPPSSAGMRRL